MKRFLLGSFIARIFPVWNTYLIRLSIFTSCALFWLALQVTFVKIQTTSKNSQRYYTTMRDRSMRDRGIRSETYAGPRGFSWFVSAWDERAAKRQSIDITILRVAKRRERKDSGEFDQNFSKKSNAPGFAPRGGGGGGHGRFWNWPVHYLYSTKCSWIINIYSIFIFFH